ncbi:hypothetical protein CJP74_06935 [Psittacicella melopsittaci]|uniref:Uncharacterized protein n=1 Tax=Psittacicella melopsittaci TaxID=2028576 RepID=A0A3A1Y1Z9_9GAMM|nr:hypothetical protein [Psittacicella melopsittaci]RIY31585.1 hypothetical protein CJP74_06935 [Psittacicella melopsittaci]
MSSYTFITPLVKALSLVFIFGGTSAMSLAATTGSMEEQAEDRVAKYFATHQVLLKKAQGAINTFLASIANLTNLSYDSYYTQLSTALIPVLPYQIKDGIYSIPNSDIVYQFATKCSHLAAFNYNRPEPQTKGKWEAICSTFVPVALAFVDQDRFISDLTNANFAQLEYKRIRFTLHPNEVYAYNYIAQIVNPVVVAARIEAKDITPKFNFKYSLRPAVTSNEAQQAINILNLFQYTLGLNTKIIDSNDSATYTGK